MKGDKINEDLRRLEDAYTIFLDKAGKCMIDCWDEIREILKGMKDAWLRETVIEVMVVWIISHRAVCNILEDLMKYLKKEEK